MTSSRPHAVILTSVHPPFDPRIFEKQARSLAAGGFAVTLIAPIAAETVRDGVRVVPFRAPEGRLLRILLSPWRMLRAALAARGDSYHFHDPELLLTGVVLRLLGKRVIYDVHEDVAKDIRGKAYLARWVRPPLAWVVGLVEAVLSRRMSLVILAREDLQETFARHPRTLLIRNFPMKAMFADRPAAAAGPAGSGFGIAYVGGLVPIRGIAELVQALALVPAELGVRLAMYGTFWPEGFEARLRREPGWHQVDFHGQIPYAQLPGELARAQAGVVTFLPVPNNINSGPTKLFEYMASGLPVVCSNFPMWREVVEGANCGVTVDPADPAAIAAAFERLARDPSAAAAMGARGRAAVLAEYNWEAEAARLLAAYRVLHGR